MHQSSYLGYRMMFDHQIERSGLNSLNFVPLYEMRNVYFFSYHNIVTRCITNNSITLCCNIFIFMYYNVILIYGRGWNYGDMSLVPHLYSDEIYLS